MEALTNFRVALESFMSSSNDTPVLKVIYCVLLGLLLLGVLAILVAFIQGMRYDSLNRKRQEEQYLKMMTIYKKVGILLLNQFLQLNLLKHNKNQLLHNTIPQTKENLLAIKDNIYYYLNKNILKKKKYH